MQPAKLRIVALVCLVSSALLALALAHTRVPYSLENPALEWLGPRSANRAWAGVAEVLATPVVCAVLVASFVLASFRRAPLRVVVYAAFAGVAVLVSEHIDKPLVQRIYDGESTFPSGSVTLAAATALAMWLALYPLLRTRAASDHRLFRRSLGPADVAGRGRRALAHPS